MSQENDKTLRDRPMIASLGEDRLIEVFTSAGLASGREVEVEPGDDAAAWTVEPGESVVATTDTLVEGVHFELAWSDPRSVGRKLMAVNLSDLAAMGARPRYALLSVALPPDTVLDVVQAIADGIKDRAVESGVAIIGGNTARTTGPIVLTATLVGSAPTGTLLLRKGSRPGDALYVTGNLGDARAGLMVLKSGLPCPDDSHEARLARAQSEPSARVKAGQALRDTGVVHALADISDGLGRDVRRLLSADRLGVTIDRALLPISPALRALAPQLRIDAEDCALEGGEDYELLFTADPADDPVIRAACLAARTPVTRIGTVRLSPTFEVRRADGTTNPLPEGFDHFGGVSRPPAGLL